MDRAGFEHRPDAPGPALSHSQYGELMDQAAVTQPCGLAVKNLPAVQETWVQSLGWEDPLEKEMETQSSILAWKISWTEEPGGLQPMGSQSRARLSD